MQKSPNSPYGQIKPNLTLNLKHILNQDQPPPTLKSSPHISHSHQKTAIKTPTQAKYAPLRRTPPSTLRKKSLSSLSPQKSNISLHNLASTSHLNTKNSKTQKFYNFNNSGQQAWIERPQESYQFDQLSAQKTPDQFGRQSIMTEHQHPRIQYPASTRHNQVHLSTGSAITTSHKGLRNLNQQNIASQSSLGSINNSLQQFQQSSTYSSKKDIGPRNISITHSASGCTTPGGHLALTSISLSQKAKKQAQKAQMVSQFREYGITHVNKDSSTHDQNKNSSPSRSIRRAQQQSKVLSSSSSSTANKNPINTPQTGYDRERQRLYELGAFPSGGRVTRAQSGEIQTPFNLERVANHGIRMSRGQLTQGSPASSSTTMSPPRNNLAINRSSINAGGHHLATIASSNNSEQQQDQYLLQEQKQQQRQVEEMRKNQKNAVIQMQNDHQQPLPSSRSCYSQMTERQKFHYQAYEEEFEQNFGRNPHLHSKYIDQIISKMDQKFQTLGAMTRDFEDNQCDLLLFKNKLYRVISDVQNDLRQSANIIHILTQDRIRLKEIFCKQGIELEKMKEALNELKQMHQRIFKQKSLADQSIESLISQIGFHKNQNQRILLITHQQANEIARLKRILNQKMFQAEASGMMQQKDMTSLLRENQQLRQQLESSLLERPSSSINNRMNRGGGGGHIHNQTATAAEILNKINTMRSRSYRPLEGTRSALSAYSNYSSLAPNTNRSDFSPNRYFDLQYQQQQQYYGRENASNIEGNNLRPYSSQRIDYDTSIRRSHSASKNNQLRRVEQAIQNMLHLMDVDFNSKIGGKNKQRAIQNELNSLLNRRYSSFQELYYVMNNLLDKYYKGRRISSQERFNPNKNHVHQIMSLFCKIMEDSDDDDDDVAEQSFNVSNRKQKSRRQNQKSKQAATSPLQQHKQYQNQSYSRPRTNRIAVGVSPRNSSPRQSVTQRIHGQQNFPNQNQSEIIQSPSRSMSHWDSPFKGQNAGYIDQDDESNNLKRKSAKNKIIQEQKQPN